MRGSTQMTQIRKDFHTTIYFLFKNLSSVVICLICVICVPSANSTHLHGCKLAVFAGRDVVVGAVGTGKRALRLEAVRTSDELLCAYTNLPKNTLMFVNLGKILKILFGEDLEFSLLQANKKKEGVSKNTPSFLYLL